MRADRLLSIVLLLQRHGHLKAHKLAEMLGVTQRTIYRDIETLSMSGIPVYTRTGPDGGCFLDEQYRSRLNWFTGAEIQTLLYAGSAMPLSELGMQTAMENAVLKLLALLPDRYQQEAELMKQRLYLDASGWYSTNEVPPNLARLKDAVWEDRVIDVRYENWEGDQQPRTLAPYSLVYKADHWYLVAASYPSDDALETMRTYRISRLTGIQIQMTQFDRNPQFDIVAYWQAAAEQFLKRIPLYPVILKAHKNTLIYFRHMLYGRYEVLEKQPDGWVLRVNYTVFEEARTSVLGLGIEVEVIEPVELHEAVIEQARAILDKHGATIDEKLEG